MWGQLRSREDAMRSDEQMEDRCNTKVNQMCKPEQCSDSDKSGHILPLNLAVIQRIRLNISTELPSGADSNEAVVCIEAKRSDDNTVATVRQNIGTILQNTMKQKLANVLHTDSESFDDNNGPQQVIDTKSLLDYWSELDSQYQKINDIAKNTTTNVICGDSELWLSFDQKMRRMRLFLNQISSQTKRSAKQSQQNKKRKRSKLFSKTIDNWSHTRTMPFMALDEVQTHAGLRAIGFPLRSVSI